MPSEKAEKQLVRELLPRSLTKGAYMVVRTKKETSARAVRGKKKVSHESHEEEVAPKLRIRLLAYDYKVLDASVKQIMDASLRYGVEFVGPVPLPIEKRRYTVNRSSFVHKNSREQFEIRVHKRLIDIVNPTQKIIEALTNLKLPAGVDIEMKMV